MNHNQLEATESVVPRDAVATPAQALKALELTEEQRDELRKEQALLKYRSRARLTDNDRRIGRGVELERHYRITGQRDGLAEALALQGRYAEAADTAEDPTRRDEYAAMAMAVECDDRDCACDSFREESGYLLPNQHIEMYGHSRRHNREVPFVRCQICRTLNAAPTPPTHLIEQRAMRHSNAPDHEKQKFFKK